MLFKTINEIRLNDDLTWQNKCFLTFDMDWAHDDVLSFVLDWLECKSIKATWFVTHNTPLLDRIRSNKLMEVGIHPNFNSLLDGKGDVGGAERILDELLELVPEAKSIRSHSLFQSGTLQNMFKSKGLLYDCNHFVPFHQDLEMRPWAIWNGLIKVPHGWEDDICFMSDKDFSVSLIKQCTGLCVFDFHPIHVYLNTPYMDWYEKSRPNINDISALSRQIFEGAGTFNALQNVYHHFNHLKR